MVVVMMMMVMVVTLVVTLVVVMMVVVVMVVVLGNCISLADTSHANREGKHQGQHQLYQIRASQLGDAV